MARVVVVDRQPGGDVATINGIELPRDMQLAAFRIPSKCQNSHRAPAASDLANVQRQPNLFDGIEVCNVEYLDKFMPVAIPDLRLKGPCNVDIFRCSKESNKLAKTSD